MTAKAKFTPGPWRFYIEPQPNGCPVVGVGGLMVAMLAHSVNEVEEKETAIANARLISAAPDLLAALENLVLWVMPIAGDNNSAESADYEIRTVDAATKAIAKAQSAQDGV